MQLLSRADVIDDGYKSEALNEVMDQMQQCMPCAMEEDAQAFERMSALVQYVLATCLAYTGEEPRPVPGLKTEAPWATHLSNKYTWTTVQTYLEEHVLPFVARLLLGEGKAAQAVGVAQAPGVVPFKEWLASLESEYEFEPPPFVATLQAMIEDVDVMRANNEPGRANWGPKTEQEWAQLAFAARLDAAQRAKGPQEEKRL